MKSSAVFVLASLVLAGCSSAAVSPDPAACPIPDGDASSPRGDGGAPAPPDAGGDASTDEPQCYGNALRWACSDALVADDWGFDATCARGWKHAPAGQIFRRDVGPACTTIENPEDTSRRVVCCPAP